MNWNHYYEILNEYLLKYDYGFRLIDAIVFLIYLIATLYLLTFVIAARVKKYTPYPPARKKNKILVLYTAYNNNKAIFNSLMSFDTQSYPRDCYDILVITDNCTPDFIGRLQSQNAQVISVTGPHGSVDKDYLAGIEYVKENQRSYDIVVTMKAGSQIDKETLSKINDAYYSGCDVIQTHRVALNSNENIAIIESISEEANNSIFREGHTAIGLSSALSGSGMAFDFDLFCEVIPQVNGLDIEKQLETILLKQNIYIEYLNSASIYEEKSKDRASYYKARRGWFANQTSIFMHNCLLLPAALFQGKIDYFNKLIQWMLPSRIILFGIVALVGFFLIIFDFVMATKWILLLWLLILTFLLAIPNRLINKRFIKALIAVPGIFVMSILNLFRPRSSNEE